MESTRFFTHSISVVQTMVGYGLVRFPLFRLCVRQARKRISVLVGYGRWKAIMLHLMHLECDMI